LASARSYSAPNQRRTASIQLIRDQEHVTAAIEQGIRAVRTSVWIATANLKDVHVEAAVGTRARAHGKYVSLFEELEQAARRDVDVRILHAGPPSRALARHLKPASSRTVNGAKKKSGVQLRRCLRVHLKMIAVDGRLLYLGSANFTGAGLGAKGNHRRNFEAGIVTDDEWLLDEMQGTFDAIWTGRHCKHCLLRSECPKPLDQIESPTG
jgi:phosphatidylserine/phosphatidylglycerophosphate/cardiolipin synthase-like enzyme